MRVLLTLAFVFICFSGSALAQQNSGDTVTDDDIKSALHGGGTPVSSAPREYAPAPKPPDDEESATPEEQGDVQTVTQGAATTATPAPAPSPQSKNSLMDLKAAQDEVEADEGAPALQAIGDGVKTSCPSREIAATVKMPDLTKMYRSDGDTSQAHKCEYTFQRLPDSCAEDNPCTVCEKAVKAYTDACMYVGNSMGMEDSTGINAVMPERAPQPINRIPYNQGTH
jgi:hypothetical protein